MDTKVVAEKANQIKDQAAQFLSKIDVKKTTQAVDTFITKFFGIEKVVAAFLMVICVVVMIGSLIYWVFAGPSGLKTPDFDTWVAKARANETSKFSLDEKNAVREKYTSDIKKVMEIGSLPEDFFERCVKDLCSSLCEVDDEEYRSEYMDGLIDFMRDYKQQSEKEKTSFDGEEAVREYKTLFKDAKREMKKDEVESEKRRDSAISKFTGALWMLVLLGFIPLLLKIEQNTRK